MVHVKLEYIWLLFNNWEFKRSYRKYVIALLFECYFIFYPAGSCWQPAKSGTLIKPIFKKWHKTRRFSLDMWRTKCAHFPPVRQMSASMSLHIRIIRMRTKKSLISHMRWVVVLGAPISLQLRYGFQIQKQPEAVLFNLKLFWVLTIHLFSFKNMHDNEAQRVHVSWRLLPWNVWSC